MHFAAIDWLSISINLLLVIFVIVCLLMTLLVLMQRPKQEGLGAAFGGGVTDQVFGARTTNVLQRGTVYLASLFFLLSLTLAVLISHQNKKTSMLAPKAAAAEVKAEEVNPAEPVEAQPKSLLEELPAEQAPAPAEQSVPVEPPAPTDPSAPAQETAPAEPTAPPVPESAPAENAAPAEPAPENNSGQP